MIENEKRSNCVHNCMFNHELLVVYASGNANSQERTTVERHLAQCDRCRKEITELEHVWWCMDIWEDESESVIPRYNDLRVRVAASQEETSNWHNWLTSLHRNALSLWESIHPKPAIAFGVFLIATLGSVPIFKQNFGDTSKQSVSLSKDDFSILTQSKQQQTFQLASSQIEVAKATEVEKASTFDQAAMLSERDESESKKEIRKRLSGYQNLRTMNVGDSPSARVLPAHKTTPDQRPTTINPLVYHETFRVE